MKAILLIDMPDGTEAEDYYMMYGLFANKGEKPFRLGEVAFECKKVDLNPLPESKDIGYPNDDYDVGFADGWDACLKELEK